MLMAVLGLTSSFVTTWYGPAVAEFKIEFSGNPYDPAENDVRVKFTAPDGKAEERLAFYTGNGSWKSVLVTKTPGTYTPTLLRNGKPSIQAPTTRTVQATESIAKGFVKKRDTGFIFDDGSTYVPLGFNLSWQNGDLPPMTESLKKMGENGTNWTRIWACHWDGKNPWWPVEGTVKDGEFNPPALEKWDSLLTASETHGQYAQFVLFHHGQWTTRVNPNWQDNPWNTAKGGFLKDPGDFFTNPEAKRRAKNWLRYAVARYGHYQSVMCWELFNEVEWVEARYQDRWPDIAAWHGEMADYLRSIDPYNHLVTSSSDPIPAVEEAFYAKMDYYQPHTYPANVLAAIGKRKFPTDKPGFFGEFGPPDGPDYKQGIRDGIYGGLLAGHAGAGQYWYWDRVEKDNLYPIFARAAAFMKAANFGNHRTAAPVSIRTNSGQNVDLSFRPGIGWGKSRMGTFNLPADWEKEGEVSSYLIGATGGNKAMYVPIEFKFRLAEPGTARFRIASASKGGASLRISVNGAEAYKRDFPAGENETRVPEPIELALPKGDVSVKVENLGADWVNFSSFSLPGLADSAKAHGLSEGSWAAVRLLAKPGSKVTLGGLPLLDGTYTVQSLDLAATAENTSTVTVKNGNAEIQPKYAETGLVFRKSG